MSRHLLRPSLRHNAVRAPASAAGGAADIYTYLVSWWAMEEASGDRADSHGTNTLTATGTVINTTGTVGNAMLANSSTSAGTLTVTNASVETGDVDWAIAFWASATVGSGTRRLVSKANEWSWGYTLSTSYNFTIEATTVTAPWAGGFFVCWYTGGTMYMSANNAAPTSATVTAGADPATALTFGYGGGNSGNGYMDEVAFWKGYIPTADERTWLYNAGSGRAYAAFAAQYGG